LTPARPQGAAPTGLERLVGRPLTPAERVRLRTEISRRRREQIEAADLARWAKGQPLYRKWR
jgi:hypothetical protein